MGLVAGVCLSNTHNVTLIDSNPARIASLKEGGSPIYEPGLEDLLNANAFRLSFSTSYESCQRSDVIFLAVGTPEGPTGAANLTYLWSALASIQDELKRAPPCLPGIDPPPKTLVIKSTVPVGTADEIRAKLTVPMHVVSNPEFLREGHAINDFLYPERIVIGTEDTAAHPVMRAVYVDVCAHSASSPPILFMDHRSAELTKYAANAMLATRISFMNDMASLCEAVKADVELVRQGMGGDSRIGPDFLKAGIGYGGSCFPKDVKALSLTARQYSVHLGILAAVEEINLKAKKCMLNKAIRHYPWPEDPIEDAKPLSKAKLTSNLLGKTFAVWGLAFKPDTDDTREAPALVLIQELLAAGAKVRVYDPQVKDCGLPVTYCTDKYDVLHGADALFICTEWEEFRSADLEKVNAYLSGLVIFDGRNIFSPEAARKAGFTYYGVGRQ